MKPRISPWLVSFLVLCAGRAAASESRRDAQPGTSPRVFLLDGPALREIRERIAAGTFSGPALDRLRREAEAAMKVAPLSVMQKTATPPSGDKHDYTSMGPYWWPNPKTPNGLPYVRHDGRVNPQARQMGDAGPMVRMVQAVTALSLGYYLLRNHDNATHAALLLRTWFLDPATRMNPNLNYAQAIPGITQGRGTGIITTRALAQVVDDVGLLADSPAWTTADQSGMEQWFARYLDWLRASPNGQHEAHARNNHGSFNDVQVVSFALFTGKTDLARRVLENARGRRVTVQIQPDGRQPLELARTNSLGYSTFNLSALFELARLGDKVGVDLWHYQTPDGRSIRKALEFLVPYASGRRKWPYQQIRPYQSDGFARLLLIASKEYDDHEYKRLALQLDPSLTTELEYWLLNAK